MCRKYLSYGIPFLVKFHLKDIRRYFFRCPKCSSISNRALMSKKPNPERLKWRLLLLTPTHNSRQIYSELHLDIHNPSSVGVVRPAPGLMFGAVRHCRSRTDTGRRSPVSDTLPHNFIDLSNLNAHITALLGF